MKQGLRRRIVLATVGAFALALALLLTGFNLILAGQLSGDINRKLEARADAQIATLSESHGKLRVSEAPGTAFLEGGIWVFADGKAIERPPAPRAVDAAARSLAGVAHPTKLQVTSNRMLARPARIAGHRAGTVVAAVSLEPYERTQRVALIGSIAMGLGLLALVAVLARQMVGAALKPVRRMTEQAATWSDRDLHRRFGLGTPHDELTALAATLDGLLGRVDASLRHEQRFSAEVAHELRTPLARQRAEVELAINSGDPQQQANALSAVLDEIERMTAIINTLVAAAQADADPRLGIADARAVAEGAVDAVAERAETTGKSVTLHDGNQQIAVGVDGDLAVQILMPLMDNAVRFARSSAQIAFEPDHDSARFTITDDGPGLAADEVDRVFEPGFRGSAASAHRGSGLGLSLARRLARAAGGDIRGVAGQPGGRFEATLPLS